MHLTAEGHQASREVVRYIRPPKALGFPTQLPGEVLMAIISWTHVCCCLIFGKSAFKLWKPGLFQKLFTYGCHDTGRGQRTRVENRVHFGMHCVGKQCLGIVMATWYDSHWALWLRFIASVAEGVCCKASALAASALSTNTYVSATSAQRQILIFISKKTRLWLSLTGLIA